MHPPAVQTAPHRRPCIMVNETSEPEAASHRYSFHFPPILSFPRLSTRSCPPHVASSCLLPLLPPRCLLLQSSVSRCSNSNRRTVFFEDLIILMNLRNSSSDLGDKYGLGRIFLSGYVGISEEHRERIVDAMTESRN